jgi:predicted nucleic acid-binding protein
VYLDSSVGLAHLLNEDVVPPQRIWMESLVSSRLLEYESWRRLHNLGLAESHGESLRAVLSSVALLDLPEPIVGRARDAFPVPLRTLDALHLSSLLFLAEQGQKVQLATYDRRLRDAAGAMGVHLYELVG